MPTLNWTWIKAGGVAALKKLHVDDSDNVSHLSVIAKTSSGVVSGLRGTGKTHLLLLARDLINKHDGENKAFCVYVNLKKLSVPSDFTQDGFNRILSLHFINELISQISIEMDGKLGFFDSIFKTKKAADAKRLGAVISALSAEKQRCVDGSENLRSISGFVETVENTFTETLNKSAALGMDISSSPRLSISNSVGSSSTAVESNRVQVSTSSNYDPVSLKQALKSVIRSLGIGSITFFIDEWEKIYRPPHLQRWAAEFINKINDSPVHFWIAHVPYRGELKPLAVGADLQHLIDLDKDLVIENSSSDKQKCLQFFTSFVNRRLAESYPGGGVSIDTLINNKKKLELLILGCMGNPRDFGTTLLDAWNNYKRYRVSANIQGRPYQYITEPQIREAVKSDGIKKKSNISGDSSAQSAWNVIIKFLSEKDSSHFAIEEIPSQLDAISQAEISELLYQRLIFIRKRGVEAKDSGKPKLSILAASYSATVDLHDKSFAFIKDHKAVHDKVRRYVIDLKKVVDDIRRQQGHAHPCAECSEMIDINRMSAAWEKNSCPFCGGNIRK